MKNTMTLKVWNKNTFKFDETPYTVPTFVLDETAFAARVNAAHIISKADDLEKAVERTAKKAATAREQANAATAALAIIREKAEQAARIAGMVKASGKEIANAELEKANAELEKAEQTAAELDSAATAAEIYADGYAEERRAFDAARGVVTYDDTDNIAISYAVAFDLAKLNTTTAGHVPSLIRDYAMNWIQCDEFTDERKAELMGARRACNAWLSDRMGNRDSVYKTHAIELNATAFNYVVYAAVGAPAPETVNGANGAVRAMNIHPKKDGAIIVHILRGLFVRYGCDYSPEKKVKKVFGGLTF